MIRTLSRLPQAARACGKQQVRNVSHTLSGTAVNRVASSGGQLCRPAGGVRQQWRLSSNLVKKLEREIAEEESGDEDVDAEIQSLVEMLKERNMTLTTELGHRMVKISGRGKGGEKMLVEFDIDDEVQDPHDMAMEMAMAEDGLSENMGDVNPPGMRFYVTLSKGSERVKFTVLASESKDNPMFLDQVTHIPPGKNEEDDMIYPGPAMQELPDDLRDELYVYLQDRGIDAEFCQFVLAFSDAKEQQEYLSWLKKCQKFFTST